MTEHMLGGVLKATPPSEATPSGTEPAPPTRQQAAQAVIQGSVLTGIISFAIRHWGQLLATVVIGGAMGVGLSFLFQPRFRSTAQIAPPPVSAGGSFLPEGLGSIATSLGISVAGGGRYSPEFITALIESRDVVDSVLLQDLSPTGRTGATMATYLARRGNLTPRQFWNTRKTFLNRLDLSLDVRSGVISLSFWDVDPQIAELVLRRLLEEADSKLIESEHVFASARRDYLRARSAEFQRRLAMAEDSLTGFQIRNRSIQNSPMLQLEGERLSRRVALAQEMNIAVEKQLEAAELQVLSDVPRLAIVEHPNAPSKKYFPRRSLWALSGIGLAVALLLFRFLGWDDLRTAVVLSQKTARDSARR